jgi:hypothetical protein
LQVALNAFRDVLADAREQLGVDEYRALIEVAVELVAREAARFTDWGPDAEDAA